MGKIGRRYFLIAAGAFIAAPMARAQQAGRTYRVAIVLTTSPIAEMLGDNPAHPLTRAILHDLRKLGYVEGRNLIFDRRSAEGRPERYAEIVADLVRLNTDVMILSGQRELARAAQLATRRIPILLLSYNRAVEDGLVETLARPGGNITGLTGSTGWEEDAKRLELFKDLVPKISRVAYLAPKAFWNGPQAEPVRRSASALGIELVPTEQHPTDPVVSFTRIAQQKVDAVFVAPSSTSFAQREQLGLLALKARLPSSFGYSRMVETGGLMSYSTNIVEEIRKISTYVDRILKGAKAGDLPMEQPTKFELVVNLKTAKALGLTLAPSVLSRADRVIE